MATVSLSGKAVGQSVKRVDGLAKVTGRARYAGDFVLPGMIFGRCLRSPHPSARIVSIDTRQAKALPGVHAVLTDADVPDIRYGRMCKDIPILAEGLVRFVGEKVAAVAAESVEIAEAALELIDVGTIVNPTMHQGQIEGGLIQAVGQAMSEQVVLKNGAVITAHLGDYKLPTIMDIPEFETVLLPGGSGPGAFGTTSMGEMSNMAVPAAITNAVFDAVGVRLVELPISAERVLVGLGEEASAA